MKANEKHEAFFQSVIQLMRTAELEPMEMLAVLSNMVGKCIAYQDQRKYTSSQIMDVVRMNIEIGNKQVIDKLMNSTNEIPI